jgi:hypothetical protein
LTDLRQKITDALIDRFGFRLIPLIYWSDSNLSKLDRECWSYSKRFVEKEIPRMRYDSGWVTVINTPFYKCYSKPFKPTSITGSAMNGARLNIGGAQGGGRSKELGPLAKKRGALYYGLTPDTAKLEAFARYVTADSIPGKINQIDGLISKNPNEAVYELTSSCDFNVVDFEKAVHGLQGQGISIDAYLNITKGMNGEWEDLKYPAPVQLLARWLTDKSGLNGIVYDSTVHPENRNVVWYVLDDEEANKTFQYSELSIKT